MSDEVTLTAEVLGYTPNAMRDEFDNGGFQFYDSVRIKILSPAPLARELTVYHAGTIEERSAWRAVGKKIAADVNTSHLGSQVLFDGAFRNVRLSPDKQPLK